MSSLYVCGVHNIYEMYVTRTHQSSGAQLQQGILFQYLRCFLSNKFNNYQYAVIAHKIMYSVCSRGTILAIKATDFKKQITCGGLL